MNYPMHKKLSLMFLDNIKDGKAPEKMSLPNSEWIAARDEVEKSQLENGRLLCVADIEEVNFLYLGIPVVCV